MSTSHDGPLRRSKPSRRLAAISVNVSVHGQSATRRRRSVRPGKSSRDRMFVNVWIMIWYRIVIVLLTLSGFVYFLYSVQSSARTIVVDCGVAVTFCRPYVTWRPPRRIERSFEGYGRSLRIVRGVRREAAAVVTCGCLRQRIPCGPPLPIDRLPIMVYFYICVENVKSHN